MRIVVVAAEVVIVYSVCPHSYYCFCCCYSLLLAPILALLRTLAAARAAQSYIVRLRCPQSQRCFVIFQTSLSLSFALPPASHWFLCMCLCAVPTIISIPGYTILLDNLECVLTIFQFRSIFSACQFCILFCTHFFLPLLQLVFFFSSHFCLSSFTPSFT